MFCKRNKCFVISSQFIVSKEIILVFFLVVNKSKQYISFVIILKLKLYKII